ncbi:hypothetical protein AbraCBS73388_002874 [Aspergillus brasiliensis]|uniref:Heterokaryon incompatibility domain-containing protein n=1 Tax=Aspergillus brasiliensis TaxID=319629 RepID=A0A9W5YZY9_9EURO|nr:hypothetical protein AbraCBS73388_002874 [Aspergillus brasiliensis]
MLFGAAKEVMEQTGLLPDATCRLTLERESLFYGETVGGIKCDFTIKLYVGDSPENWTLSEQSMGEKAFRGTIEPTHGHYLISTPIPQQTVDWSIISEWVRHCHCSAEHKESCQTKLDGSHIADLRVIDTRQRCITVAPATCRYAALSYVWGATSSLLQATTANIDHLVTEGSLTSDILPQTIDDAIVACRSIGIDYLWVDRLCILQDDDPDTKAYWLNSMGDIYAQSYVTIVALAGKDAEHGLPGVNMVKRPGYRVRTTQGIYLIDQGPDYAEILQGSRWANRGWTFQEAALSTRRLVFSDMRVFYECYHSETMQDEVYGAYSKPYETSVAPLSSYGQAVEDFTKRELTWESDVLRAFSGVLHTGWGPHSYYGLPLSIFSDAVLWKAWDWSYPTRNAASGEAFPTWSWASIKCPISIISAGISESEQHKLRASLAIWAIPNKPSRRPALQVIPNTLGEAGGLNELEELELLNRRYEEALADRGPMDYGPRSFSMWARLAVVIAWRCGCFSGSLPSILHTQATWTEYEKIVSNWKSLAQLCDEAHGMPGGNMSEADMAVRFPMSIRQECPPPPPPPPPGSIFVYTQSLNVNPLKLSLKREHYHRDQYAIEHGDDFMAQVIPGSLNLERINHVRQQNPDSVFHLLSLSILPDDCIRPLGPVLKDEDFWYDSAGTKLRGIVHRPFEIELMLVETENGMSRRVGLAWAYLKHWVDQKPQFGTFHLV